MRLRFILITVACAVACESNPKKMDGATALSDDFRALAYSNAFAERFQLPPADAVELDSGVSAIAIRVYRDVSFNLTCLLSLYLDDSVPFAYPAGTQSRNADLTPHTGPLFFVHKLNDADAKTQLERIRNVRVLLKSRNYSESRKQGVEDSGPVQSFYRDILPGLNVVEYVPICTALDPKYAPADVWLLREGHEANDITSLLDSADTSIAIRVAIPESLMKVAASATKRAASEPVKFNLTPPPKYIVPPRGAK